MSLERDLVAECKGVAAAMNVFLAVVGQRKARGSGTELGFPDLVAIASGKVALIELKRTKDAENPAGRLNLGQQAFMERCQEHGVKVHVVDNVGDFVTVVNEMRRPSSRARESP